MSRLNQLITEKAISQVRVKKYTKDIKSWYNYGDMVNTVGSYQTRYWHKNLIPLKQAVVITPLQHSIIIGSLLGDGTMRLGKGARNASFKTEQGLQQKTYVFWKYLHLKPLVLTEPKISYRYQHDTKEKYEKSWWFRTIRHPLLTEICYRFYKINGHCVGKKIIPRDIHDILTPMALAVWIMDDGSYNGKKIDISTYAFTLSEIHLLQKCIEKRYGVEMKYYRDRNKGYRLYCNQKETAKLVNIINPYVIDSMKYKIGLVNPVTTGS